MAGTINDVLVRLTAFTESDALDFNNKRRAVFVVEDGQGTLPLPKGDKGDKGAKGDPGSLRPDLVIDFSNDADALKDLQSRSASWGTAKNGYFAVNKATKSGFFYQSPNWSMIANIFGSGVAGEYNTAVIMKDVSSQPATPAAGSVALFCEGGSLKVKKSNGLVVVLA